MEILMDVAGFTLGEANSARKIVAKKQMSKIPELRKQVYDKMQNDNIADYIWEIAVRPQLGWNVALTHLTCYRRGKLITQFWVKVINLLTGKAKY